ncbi:MAG: alpha/beta hydrolase [Acetobacteraceae bacterium]|nr:alpha/beta hydrolase [Acetobacteraceae bacterium]
MQPRLGALRVELDFGAVDLRWTEWGPAEGAAVVCVHGLTRNARDFDALAQALAAQGRRVLCVDVPGRGLSSWLPRGELYAVPNYVAAMRPLLAALDSYDWVGTSMGGLIGMAVAAMPESGMRRFVINDIGPFVPAASLERIRAYLRAAPADFAGIEAVEAELRRVHAPFGDLSDAEWRHLAIHSSRMTEGGRLRLHYDRAIAEPMGTEPLADIEFWPLWDAAPERPVLVLRGETSDLLLPETATRMAARARVETIPGCGHAPALMAPAQVALVAGFLDG